MIKNRHLIGSAYVIHQRTYTRKEWNVNRMRYITEARELVDANPPAKVLLYVKDDSRARAILMVTVIAH